MGLFASSSLISFYHIPSLNKSDSIQKYYDIIELFLDYGADINIPNQSGQKIKWVDSNKNQIGGNKKKIIGRRYL